jgi:hypothetical protein
MRELLHGLDNGGYAPDAFAGLFNGARDLLRQVLDIGVFDKVLGLG